MADGIERSASAPTRSSADLRGPVQVEVQVEVRFARSDEFRPVAHPRASVRPRRHLVRRDRLVQRRGGGVELDLRILISFLPKCRE
jgi:hypothetical protein